jgi:PmbA protein
MHDAGIAAAAPQSTTDAEAIRRLARQAVELAQRHGAQQSAASTSAVREVEVAWRDGQLERMTEAVSRGLGIELFVDGRYASVSTSDLRPEALQAFVADAVAMTRALTPDRHRHLPDPSLYPHTDELGDDPLELYDPAYATLTAVTRRAQAEAIEAAVRSHADADRILSVTASVSDTLSESFRCDSQGFEGHRRGTAYWRSAEVSVQDPDGRRPEEGEYNGARHLSDVLDPAEVGRRAVERALRRIGASKPKTAQTAVLVQARAAGRLVSSLLGPLSGAALQQQRSFYEGREGTQLGSPLLQIVDDPLVPRGLGSRRFDAEGIASRPLVLFDSGVPHHVYIDTYYGSKLGRAPTTGRMSNLAWQLGDRDLDALIGSLTDGVLVTGFVGGNSNPTTGDFSLGIQGFAIRNGKLDGPLGEMNLSGSHLDLWQRLTAVGNDPNLCSPMRTPSLLFGDVQIAGA